MCVCILLSLTLRNPWTVVHKAPLSMEFSGKNVGVRHCSPRGCYLLRDRPMFPVSPALQVNSLPIDPSGKLKWGIVEHKLSFT